MSMIPVFLLTKIAARIKMGILSRSMNRLMFRVISPNLDSVRVARMDAMPVTPPGAKLL